VGKAGTGHELVRQRGPRHDLSRRLLQRVLPHSGGCPSYRSAWRRRAAQRMAACRCDRAGSCDTGGGALVRLLLTHGYFLESDVKEQKIMKPYAPLGLLYLSAHLRAKGFEVEIYDSTFGSMEGLKRLLRNSPGVLGIYGNLMTRPNVLA